MSLIPTQLPNGVSEELVVETAKTSIESFNTLLVLQLIQQLFFKGAFERALNLLYFLQVVRTLSVYSVNLPAILQIFLDEIRIMIDFRSISADSLLDFLVPGLTVQQLL